METSGGLFAHDGVVKTKRFGESFSERMLKGGQNILRKVAFVPVTAAQQVMDAMLLESRYWRWKI